MTFGTSIVLIAVGAILKFAVHVSTTGFNLNTIGLILMVLGGIGLVLSFLWLAVWSDREHEASRRGYFRRRETY